MKRRTFLTVAAAAVSGILSGAASKVHATLADIYSKLTPHPRALKLPPIPKWNRATDDIDSADFFRRSEDYERSLLPPNLVFPRAGQVWETVRDCDVPVLRPVIAPSAPAPWPGTRLQLRAGARVRILTLDHPRPLQIRFEEICSHEASENIAQQPLRHELFMRTAPTVPIAGDQAGYFTELFRLVDDVG